MAGLMKTIGAPATRAQRRPNFPFAGSIQPFGLYPVWAHPVLPGETLQSMSSKSRVISMPVKHPMAGAWLEQWLVYVKFTDIDRNLGQMFVSDTYPTTGFTFGADAPRYFGASGQINWVQKAVERIHSAWFIHDGETPRAIDGVRQVKLNNVSWYQNMMFEPTDVAISTADASTTYEQLDAWMMLQQMNMTELTYEKYLETYGVTSVRQNVGDPEVLGFSRSWTQPTNTVEPTTGIPSSAWVWADEFKISKSKRFDEPGFLIALQCVRPKMFVNTLNLKASMVGNLWGFSDWFPSYNLSDPTARVRQMPSTEALFGANAQDAGTKQLLYDTADLLSHGEQFLNGGPSDYTLPMSSGFEVKTASQPEDMRGEYCKAADITALFTGVTASKQVCNYEGMAFAVISGHIQDMTAAPNRG